MELIAAVEATCLRSSKRIRKKNGADNHSVVNCPDASSSELGFRASSNCSTELIKDVSDKSADGLLLLRNGSFRKKTRNRRMELPPPPKKSKPSEIRRSIPSARMPPMEEIDSFFSAIETFEKKRFSEKYNFDVAKDVPMEGRYQWVQIKP